jgi:hypothetical protein
MLSVTALVAALALSTPAVVGQSEGTGDPMGADRWTGTWTHIDGTFVDGTFVEGAETSGAGYRQYLGARTSGDVTADDPRVTGTMTQVQNVHFATSPDADEGDVGIVNGTARIDNDAGAWVGTWTAYGAGSGGEEWHVMEGEGAYEGLITVFRYHTSDSSLEGVILPAGLPELPEPIAPPAE